MESEADYIEIAIGGRFDAGILSLLPDEPEVDVGVASGFAGERIVKFALKAGPAAIAAVKRLVTALLAVDRVTNIKITKGSVEIGSLRAADAAAVKELVADVLDRLGSAEGASPAAPAPGESPAPKCP